MTSSTDATNKTTSYQYDGVFPFLLTSSSDRFGNITQYQYDSKFRLKKVIDPNGNANLISHYDDNNQVTQTKDALGNETNYLVNELGASLLSIRPDNSKLALVLDLNGQVINIAVKSNTGSIISNVNYSYDELGRMISKEEGGLTYHTEYGYDSSTTTPLVTILDKDYYYLYYVKEYYPNETYPYNVKYFDEYGLLVREVSDGKYIDRPVPLFRTIFIRTTLSVPLAYRQGEFDNSMTHEF
jgi:YD repeat-containing protein